jgi:putative FmdB family regulatory protein
MPTYQYACPDCGLEFERVQKFTDDPVKKCPKCGKRKVYRVVSKVAVSFKGSGWYITDSKSTNGKSDAKSGEKEKAETTTEATEKKADATTEAATETKPDSKAEGKAEGKAEAKSDKADKPEKKPGKKKAD